MIESKFRAQSGHRDSLFCSRDLDLFAMTLMYETDYTFQRCTYTPKINFLCQAFESYHIRNRHTNRPMRATATTRSQDATKDSQHVTCRCRCHYVVCSSWSSPAELRRPRSQLLLDLPRRLSHCLGVCGWTSVSLHRSHVSVTKSQVVKVEVKAEIPYFVICHDR